MSDSNQHRHFNSLFPIRSQKVDPAIDCQRSHQHLSFIDCSIASKKQNTLPSFLNKKCCISVKNTQSTN